MRLPVSLFVFVAMFLSSCANEGVIVRKDSRPFPFYASLGVEGMYTFLLRDNAGTVRRQMVTPEVYEQYVVGDHFNDLEQGPVTRGERSDSKMMRTATLSPVKSNRMAGQLRSHSRVRPQVTAVSASKHRAHQATASGNLHPRTHTTAIARNVRKSKKSFAIKTANTQRKKAKHVAAAHAKRARKHSDSDIVFINGAPGLR